MKTISEEEKKRILDSLETEKQFIAFDYPYGPIGHTIVVNQISFLDEDRILCHFLMGHRSECHNMKKEDIIAIGDPDGDTKLCGWSGHYIILKPEMLKENEDGKYELINQYSDSKE